LYGPSIFHVVVLKVMSVRAKQKNYST
jgi:hypothetical protein